MSKYVDITSVDQVIGCVFKNPSILDATDKYIITEDDFTDNFNKKEREKFSCMCMRRNFYFRIV